MNVSFIGSGNLAWHLAPALDNTDFAVKEVFSPTMRHAALLVERLYEATTKASLDFSNSPSRIFILAVTDDAIEQIAQRIILPEDSFLFHTSGSKPLSVLGYAPTPNIGVFYPLQTFSKAKKIEWRETPIFLESENSVTENLMMKMAKAITRKVHRVTSQDRKALHVAAVFASNFTNHMLTLSKEILEENKLDFDLLKPLIAETINKCLTMGPEESLTGPARRGDLEILDNHIDFLKADEGVAEIYRVISQNIVDRYT